MIEDGSVTICDGCDDILHSRGGSKNIVTIVTTVTLNEKWKWIHLCFLIKLALLSAEPIHRFRKIWETERIEERNGREKIKRL